MLTRREHAERMLDLASTDHDQDLSAKHAYAAQTEALLLILDQLEIGNLLSLAEQTGGLTRTGQNLIAEVERRMAR